MSSNNGLTISRSYVHGYQNVLFPFKRELSYDTLNKLKTKSFEVRFEFTINEPGDWEISLYN